MGGPLYGVPVCVAGTTSKNGGDSSVFIDDGPLRPVIVGSRLVNQKSKNGEKPTYPPFHGISVKVPSASRSLYSYGSSILSNESGRAIKTSGRDQHVVHVVGGLRDL